MKQKTRKKIARIFALIVAILMLVQVLLPLLTSDELAKQKTESISTVVAPEELSVDVTSDTPTVETSVIPVSETP